VQILVAAATIQVKTLKAEVEKGFMRTAVGHELIDPKTEINLLNGKIDVIIDLFILSSPKVFPNVERESG